VHSEWVLALPSSAHLCSDDLLQVAVSLPPPGQLRGCAARRALLGGWVGGWVGSVVGLGGALRGMVPCGGVQDGAHG